MAAWRACQGFILWLDIGSLDDLCLEYIKNSVVLLVSNYLTDSFVLIIKYGDGLPASVYFSAACTATIEQQCQCTSQYVQLKTQLNLFV